MFYPGADKILLKIDIVFIYASLCKYIINRIGGEIIRIWEKCSCGQVTTPNVKRLNKVKKNGEDFSKKFMEEKNKK